MVYIIILILLAIVFWISYSIFNAPLVDKDEKLINPYKWIYYKEGWSQNQVNENNKKYWDWERKHNGFVPPNSGLKKTVKINQNNNL